MRRRPRTAMHLRPTSADDGEGDHEADDEPHAEHRRGVPREWRRRERRRRAEEEEIVEVGRRRRRDGGGSGPRAAPPAPVQDPGGDQAPPDHAGPGGQGGARHQGRGADHLSLARRPLFRADAQYRPRRRHQPQDHQRPGPQAPQGDRRRTRSAGRHGRHPAHRRRRAHQDSRSSAISSTCCGRGKRCATSP